MKRFSSHSIRRVGAGVTLFLWLVHPGVGAEVKQAPTLDERVMRWLPTKGLVGGSTFDGSMRALGEQSVPGKIGRGFSLKKGEPYALRDRSGKPVGDWEKDQAFSISLWVKAAANTTGQKAMLARMDRSQSGRGWSVDYYSVYGQMGLSLMHQRPDQGIRVRTPRGVMPRGRWHQVVVTYDGSGKGGGVALYVGGQEQPALIKEGEVSATIRSTAETLVGSRAQGEYPANDVVLDDIRIFERVLDEEEIARLARLVPGRRVGRGASVRISLPGKAVLSLAEVEVFVGGGNVASTGEAKQSTTAMEAEARLAIDENRNGRFEEGSVTHTSPNGTNPWWQVDLAFPAAIDRVVVWNRWGDGGKLAQRLDNAKVEVLNIDGKTLWQGTIPSPAPRSVSFEVGLIDLGSLGLP